MTFYYLINLAFFLECSPLQSPQMGGYSQIITGTATCFEGNQEDLSSCG